MAFTQALKSAKVFGYESDFMPYLVNEGASPYGDCDQIKEDTPLRGARPLPS